MNNNKKFGGRAMSLLDAHKGYEYQDLLSAFYITSVLLSNDKATFKIDKKQSENDKFDDLTIITDDSIVKRQIKYSENKILQKAALSSEKYDLALDILYKSWKELPKSKNIDIRLCLAWEYIEDSQELFFLKTQDVSNNYKSESVKFLKIDLEKIWPMGNGPIPSWRRLRNKSKDIDRNDFLNFIDDLIIEVDLPKSSMDFSKSGALENLVIKNLKDFGIGKFPNDKKSAVDVAMHLIYIIKTSRARGEDIDFSKLIYDLGLMSSYGSIPQSFTIDREINVLNNKKYHDLKEFLFAYNKVNLLGDPGSGKSWFVQNFMDFLNKHNVKTIKHYCYTGIDDLYEKERIKIDIFFANLIGDIIEMFPHLKNIKSSRYGVDFEELQLLINQIDAEVVLIVDGLDHIGRIYSRHQETMKKIDTEIIEILSHLSFPNNVKLLVVSQPITEVLQLKQNNFHEYYLHSWNIHEVRRLLKNNQVDDIKLDYSTMLSDLLLEKSSGNPLYLTYLIIELSKYTRSMLTQSLIETIPSYSNNLGNYYDFLIAKLSVSDSVAIILSGSPFSLTELELKEITGLGLYVKQSVETIRSILSYNKSSGGYIIYHESFRRYILDLLRIKEVSVESAIYLPLTRWLMEKDFYKDKKAHNNLFGLLFESREYNSILEYCNVEFIVDSVYNGNSIFSIKNNFEFLMKAACKIKDYEFLTICAELGNMINGFENSFGENSLYYYWALGSIYGFESLNECLAYEGSSSLAYSEGLKVCYLCSQNDVIPNWKPYINMLIEETSKSDNKRSRDIDELEEYKYYICACLDTAQNMSDILDSLSTKETEAYKEVVILEYMRRGLMSQLEDLIDNFQNKESWINCLKQILGNTIIDEGYLDIVFERLQKSDSHSDETYDALKYYCNNIKEIIKNYSDKLLEFVDSIDDRNWYYNWLVFICKVNMSIVDFSEDGLNNDEDLITAYAWLIKNMECFKGTPRTCDLYRYESFIFESIKKPLSYIISESTWKTVLDMIEKMSSETMTTLRGATSGPLPTYRLFDLLLEVASMSNYGIIIDVFERRIHDEGKYRYYSYLSDYRLKKAIVLAKSRRLEDAETAFKEGVEYLLAYSFRKDRTLSNLIDSVESISRIESGAGLQRVLRLKPLADAVVYHTDGRSTRRYPEEWFELLTRTDKDIALVYLSKELMEDSNYWLLEECFDYILEACNSEIEPIIENTLFKTRPNATSSSFIKSYLHNIEVLINKEEISLARLSMRELLSRFSKGVYREHYEDIILLRDSLELDIEVSIRTDTESSSNENKKFGLNDDYSKSSRQYSFDRMTYGNVLEHIISFGIKDGEVQGLYYYLQLVTQLTPDFRIFFSRLTDHIFDWGISNTTKERILTIIDNLNLDSKIMSYIYISLFMSHKGPWFEKLTQKEYFIKAISYDKEVAENYFFDYFYINYCNTDYSNSLSGQIINALAEIEFDKNMIIKYWDEIFKIISFRLPGQDSYDWDSTKKLSYDFNSSERLIYLLLVRLKYGETNRYKWIASGLDKMFQEEKYQVFFIEPFKHYLVNIDKFIDYSLIILIWLARKWFKKDQSALSSFLDNIQSIYPTDNGVLNYLIRDLMNTKKSRIYQNYEHRYSGDNQMVNNLISVLNHSDSRINILLNYGVDIGIIIENYAQEVIDDSTVKELRGIVYDSEYSTLVPNVYFYDMLMKHMSSEVELFINQFAGFPWLESVERDLYEVLIDDIEYIIANCNSISPRPSYLKVPEEVENSINSVEYQEWVSLAYQESWYEKRKRNSNNQIESMDSTIVFSGVGFLVKDNDIPILKLKSDYKLYDENGDNNQVDVLTDNPVIITSDVRIEKDSYLTYRSYEYLGIRADILNALSIKMKDEGEGICGYNKKGEIVIKYSRWEVCIDDIDTGSYRIPYLVGSELKVRNDVYKEICEIFITEPKRYTVKIQN